MWKSEKDLHAAAEALFEKEAVGPNRRIPYSTWKKVTRMFEEFAAGRPPSPLMDRFDEAQREREACLAATEVCPLEGYREILQETSRPGEEQITRFGHLSYATVSAPRIMIVGEGGVEDRSELPIFHTPDGSFRLPPEVVDAGAVELTAAIHPETARVWVWQMFLPPLLDPELGGSRRFWPPETGGEKTLQEVRDLCRRRDSEPLTDRIDPELQELLRPERERQLLAMTRAIGRMLDLMLPPRAS